MSSSGSSGDVYTETLAVFDQREDSSEPLTTPEVADSLNVARRTVYKRLEKLVDQGQLRTKKVGANARVWWRPPDGSSHGTYASSSGPQRSDLESTVEEVLERITDGFYGLDEQFRFTYLNNRAEDLLDLAESTVLGRDIHDELLLTDEFEATLHEVYETQEPVVLEDYYDPLDSWYENAIYPSESGLSVYFQDISERKQRERQLEEYRRQYRTLVEHFPAGVVALVDEDLRFVTFAGAPQGVPNTTRADFEGELVRDVLPREIADVVVPGYEAALDGEDSEYEATLDGRTYHYNFVPVRDDEGEVFAVTAMSQDVTEQKEQEQYLRDAKLQLEAATEAGAVGTWEWQISEDRMVTGRSFARTFGVDPDEAADGVSLDQFLSAIHHDDLERVEHEVEQAVESCGEYEGEYRVWNADGELRWVIARGHVECDDYGNPLTFPGALIDITDRKQREEELAALNRLNEVFQGVTHAVIDSSSREEIEQTITDHLTNSDSYEYAWIGHLDRHGENIVPQIAGRREVGLSGVILSTATDDPANHVADAIRTGDVQVTDDSRADPVFDRWKQSGESRPRAGISIPITHGERVYGVLNVYTARENAFDENECRIIGGLGGVVGHAINSLERKRALLEDRVNELTFRSHALAKAFTDPAGDESFTISIGKFVPLSNGETIAYYSLDGLDPAVFVDGIEKRSPDAECHVTYHEGSRARVEVQHSRSTLASQLVKYNSWIADGGFQDGEFRIVVRVPEFSTIREVKDAVTRAYPDVELVAQTEVERDNRRIDEVMADLDDQLTERQRTTLEVAYYSGFFDWPRAITGEELAERLHVTSGTISHHLRHGERKLMAAFFESTA
ncbi:MAG: bacterio-opsin activator domain-containing protein [Salinigranum sp.]